MTNQATIIDKIRNLRAKAADAAATEAEAMQAAEMAARLLMKHEISEADLAAAEDGAAGSGVTRDGFETGNKTLPLVLQGVGAAIASLTQTTVYADGGALKFVGLDADVEMALYLTELVKGAHHRVWMAYRKEHMSPGMSRREQNAHRNGVTVGFANALSKRMREMADERKAAQSTGATGSALVVRKGDLIADFMRNDGLVLQGAGRKSRRRCNSDATSYGRNAGRNVNLGRPVAGGGSRSASRIA
jgi:hypothetical protein